MVFYFVWARKRTNKFNKALKINAKIDVKHFWFSIPKKQKLNYICRIKPI